MQESVIHAGPIPSTGHHAGEGVEKIECRPVRTFPELCAAFAMAHDHYVASGFMTWHPSGMRYTALQLLPVSTTWVAIRGNEIRGTGTVVTHSPAGLPSSAVFEDHFRMLRCNRRAIAEATLLASSHHEAEALSVACAMLRHAVRQSRIHDFCIVAPPAQLSFWHGVLGFEILTDTRRCAHLPGHLGVLMRLDLRGLACGGKQPSNGYNNLILQPQDAEAIEEEPFRLSPSQIRSLIELRPNTIAAATAAQWELLRDYIGGKNCSVRFSRRESPAA